MKKILILSVFLIGTIFATKIDVNETSVNFSATRMTITKVYGKFKKFDGDITIKHGKVTKIIANINVASVDTGNAARDHHLTMTQDFFMIKKYPTAKLVLNDVSDNEKAKGTLTINGITCPVKFKIHVKSYKHDGKIFYAIRGKSSINRYKYKMTWNKKLNGNDLFLGKKIHLSFSTELTM